MVVRVWDIVIRVFHWSLVAALAVAALTGVALLPVWLTLHIVAGTLAAAAVVVRIVWGVWGPGPARFAAFVHRPQHLIEHCRALAAGRAPRHLGHNPLGGMMIVALLAVVLALGLTGALAEGGMLKSGPLAFAASFALGREALGLHQFVAWALLIMVVLHLGGVVYESRRSRDNLVRAMVDGLKPARPGDVALPGVLARPALAAVAAGVLLLGGAGTVYALAERPGLGVPSGPPDPVYTEECGACHMAYPPSLASAATWSAVMDGLGHHFGDNASLDPATEAHIRAYLAAHSAEHYDTLAAHRLSRPDPAHPLSITATPFWRRVHRSIPDSTFAAKPVVSRANCAACHHDAASGLFAPSAIDIPEDAES